VKFFLLILILTTNIFANKAVIAVLEAPLFKQMNDKANVIQYLRKGKEIYLHNLDGIQKFYQTMTTTGDKAYILKEHVLVLYNDERELYQKNIQHDNTDYRIPEPLDRSYPFKRQTGYRGMFAYGLGNPTNENNYSYSENIKDNGSSFSNHLHALWSKNAKFDETKRFFFGAMASVRWARLNYSLTTSDAKENDFRISIGPLLSYDVYRTQKLILNLYSALAINIYDRKEVNITDSLGNNSNAIYKTLNLSLKPGTNIILRGALESLDLVLGVHLDMNIQKSYKNTQKSGSYLFESSIKSGFYIEPSYLLGIQSNY
jgi:hypothetical protein